MMDTKNTKHHEKDGHVLTLLHVVYFLLTLFDRWLCVVQQPEVRDQCSIALKVIHHDFTTNIISIPGREPAIYQSAMGQEIHR